MDQNGENENDQEPNQSNDQTELNPKNNNISNDEKDKNNSIKLIASSLFISKALTRYNVNFKIGLHLEEKIIEEDKNYEKAKEELIKSIAEAISKYLEETQESTNNNKNIMQFLEKSNVFQHERRLVDTLSILIPSMKTESIPNQNYTLKKEGNEEGYFYFQKENGNESVNSKKIDNNRLKNYKKDISTNTFDNNYNQVEFKLDGLNDEKNKEEKKVTIQPTIAPNKFDSNGASRYSTFNQNFHNDPKFPKDLNILSISPPNTQGEYSQLNFYSSPPKNDGNFIKIKKQEKEDENNNDYSQLNFYSEPQQNEKQDVKNNTNTNENKNDENNSNQATESNFYNPLQKYTSTDTNEYTQVNFYAPAQSKNEPVDVNKKPAQLSPRKSKIKSNESSSFVQKNEKVQESLKKFAQVFQSKITKTDEKGYFSHLTSTKKLGKSDLPKTSMKNGFSAFFFSAFFFNTFFCFSYQKMKE